jgi:hypothetical protein
MTSTPVPAPIVIPSTDRRGTAREPPARAARTLAMCRFTQPNRPSASSLRCGRTCLPPDPMRDSEDDSFPLTLSDRPWKSQQRAVPPIWTRLCPLRRSSVWHRNGCSVRLPAAWQGGLTIGDSGPARSAWPSAVA